MTASHALLELVIVLGTAAAITVGFQRLQLPVALGYILAGLVIGPHVPVPLVADAALVHVLSELGVILLLFTIGLELPLGSLARTARTAAVIAVVEVAVVVAGGALAALALGFDLPDAIFAGACLGISSTVLVAKSFTQLGWRGPIVELVFAILVFEDLVGIVVLAVLGGVARGHGLDGASLTLLVGKLVAFLAVFGIVGQLVVPRAIRWVAERTRAETLAITSLAVCFGGAALAEAAGFSVALGAVVAGVLVAESGQGEAVDRLVAPFRDVFAALFFVSIGMTIEPAALLHALPAIAVCAVVVLAGKPLGVRLGARFTRAGAHAGPAGIALAQIGELSFVIAAASGEPALLPIAVGVACVTTVLTPLWMKRRTPTHYTAA